MLFVSCLRSDGWLTTEVENGLARPLLYRHFLFKKFNLDRWVFTFITPARIAQSSDVVTVHLISKLFHREFELAASAPVVLNRKNF